MKNTIAGTNTALKSQADKAVAGLTQHAVALNLTHVTQASLGAQVGEFSTADTNHKQAKAEKVAAALVVLTLQAISRDFGLASRDLLKRFLGSQYTQLWDEAGFINSLSVPESLDKLIQLMLDLKNYFTAHPEHENALLNLTAARAESLYNDLKAARTALINQRTQVRTLINTRNLKAGNVRISLRKLLKEMGVTVPPLDTRWLDFGFNMPGALERPDVPENVTVVLVGTNAVSVKWDSAARAEYYRVWLKIVGVDEEARPVGSPADLDFIIEALPANASIEVAVSAVNNGGESAKSAMVQVTL